MKKILTISLSVAGSIIGAGFATGKEIMLFFPENGFWGISSLFISVFLLITASLLYCFKKKNKFDNFFDYLFIFFVAASFSVMLSCGGEVLNHTFKFSFIGGVVITYLLSLFIVHFNSKGIFVFNILISPLMIIGTIIICINNLWTDVFLNIEKNSPDVLSVAYSGYNLLSLIPFLSALKSDFDKKAVIKGTVLGGFIVFLCGIFIKLVIDKYFSILEDSEIPMLKIAFLNGSFQNLCYCILIYSAALTTAINGLFALKEKGNIYFITLPLLILSFSGFDRLIKNIYGIFGYMGIGFIIYILLNEYLRAYRSKKKGKSI